MANQKAVDNILECVREAYDKMDVNDDNTVTFGEFKKFCDKIDGMEEIAQTFATYDTSDDQRLSLQELNDFVTGKVPKDKIEVCHVRKLFKSRDTSGDGKLDRAEFRALLVDCGYSDTVIENTIEAVAGEDGMVTLQEFLDKWEHDE
ncbi:calmodulin-like protein 7 [Haliotis rubra]|uniref:calmodulin-like protein 7 n=1 Tax=Haliotis rubra TaxID=36100 RepID=UPI001EE61DF5|nr:calmodulin-like protein 7 [Haliotis rubra]